MHVASLALAALAVSGALIGAGAASTSTKPAAASFASPASVAGGSTATYTLHLVNGSTNQTLGSANVTPAAGFTILAPPVAALSASWGSPATTWAADVKGGVLELRAGTSKKALPPGQTLVVTFSATAPCTAPADPRWTTVAKQSNDFKGPPGNDFFVTEHPSMPITGGGASFEFDEIDDPQKVDRPFDVTVTATCGTTVDTSYNGTATLTGTLTAGEYDPATLTFTSGVATAEVTPRTVEQDVILTATAGTRTGDSNAFDVVRWLCTAEDDEELCQAFDDEGKTHVSLPRPTGDTTIAITFDGRGGTGCEDRARLGSRVTIDPGGTLDGKVTQVTFTFHKTDAPGTGVANFVFCWKKPEWEDAQRLDPCAKPPAAPEATCELKRSRTGAGDLQIVVLLSLEDPEFELG